jgi:predicted ATP-dependent protease
VQGKKTGVVNGLAVLERGFYSFGTPLRITASVGPGKDGLINIERESGLSGELHDKGIYLLEGYLRHRYARRFPLSMSAGIAIEQSYYEIDGDSASAAELAALLSAISGIPLRQDIAVTGAVNQLGILQPVGGIHEKINGFYKTCRAKGFAETQGVIVPSANINSVILTDEIIEAVRKNMFHIWTADNIDQVMSLLSGKKPGREKRNGKFEKFSINEEIRVNLQELSELSQ